MNQDWSKSIGHEKNPIGNEKMDKNGPSKLHKQSPTNKYLGKEPNLERTIQGVWKIKQAVSIFGSRFEALYDQEEKQPIQKVNTREALIEKIQAIQGLPQGVIFKGMKKKQEMKRSTKRKKKIPSQDVGPFPKERSFDLSLVSNNLKPKETCQESVNPHPNAGGSRHKQNIDISNPATVSQVNKGKNSSVGKIEHLDKSRGENVV